MKQTLIICVIFFSALAGYSQQVTQAPHSYDKAAYSELRTEAKHSMVTGIVLSAGGGALIAGGLVTAVVGASEGQTDQYGDVIQGTENDDLIRTGLIIAGVGVVAEIVSIPFYVRSHSLKSQAREVKFHATSNSYAAPVSGFRSINRPQLGVGVTISL